MARNYNQGHSSAHTTQSGPFWGSWAPVPRTACVRPDPCCLVTNTGADTKVWEGQQGCRSWARKGRPAYILIMTSQTPPHPTPPPGTSVFLFWFKCLLRQVDSKEWCYPWVGKPAPTISTNLLKASKARPGRLLGCVPGCGQPWDYGGMNGEAGRKTLKTECCHCVPTQGQSVRMLKSLVLFNSPN